MPRTKTPSGRGPSQRQLRVGEVIRRALADVLSHGALGDPELEGVSVTVGEVRTSPDLRHATAYVMPLGGQNVEQVVAALNRQRGGLRRLVTGEIDLKYSPELTFVADATFEQMERTRALLASEAVRRDVEKDRDD
jgi:ribosome-binding factor A